jgi:hypothetical protein
MAKILLIVRRKIDGPLQKCKILLRMLDEFVSWGNIMDWLTLQGHMYSSPKRNLQSHLVFVVGDLQVVLSSHLH